MHLPTLLFAAFAVLSPLVAATPIADDDGASLLVARAADACVTKDMNIAYCNSCLQDCTQSWYVHFGASGKGSCSDKQAPFDTACTTSGNVPTPFGAGKWKKAANCNGSNPKGTYGATIVPAGGGSAWSCSCVNSKAQYTTDCIGEEYACNQSWYCACSKC